MSTFLTYHEHLNSSNSDNIVNVILDTLEEIIEDLLNRIEAREKEHDPEHYRPWSNFVRTSVRLGLIFDMVSSIEKFTKPTDKLISINTFRSPKGSLEISAQIQRDEQVYPFNTEVIYAGGHNIQRLHYRYITKTDLPKTGNSTVTKAYQDKIKRMSKADKLTKELDHYIARKQKNQDLVTTNSAFTDNQILDFLRAEEYGHLIDVTWETLSDNSHAKQSNTKESWEKDHKQHIEDKISWWKQKNIKWKKDDIITCDNQIKKIQIKLDQLAAQNA